MDRAFHIVDREIQRALLASFKAGGFKGLIAALRQSFRKIGGANNTLYVTFGVVVAAPDKNGRRRTAYKKELAWMTAGRQADIRPPHQIPSPKLSKRGRLTARQKKEVLSKLARAPQRLGLFFTLREDPRRTRRARVPLVIAF